MSACAYVNKRTSNGGGRRRPASTGLRRPPSPPLGLILANFSLSVRQSRRRAAAATAAARRRMRKTSTRLFSTDVDKCGMSACTQDICNIFSPGIIGLRVGGRSGRPGRPGRPGQLTQIHFHRVWTIKAWDEKEILTLKLPERYDEQEHFLLLRLQFNSAGFFLKRQRRRQKKAFPPPLPTLLCCRKELLLGEGTVCTGIPHLPGSGRSGGGMGKSQTNSPSAGKSPKGNLHWRNGNSVRANLPVQIALGAPLSSGGFAHSGLEIADVQTRPLQIR